MKNFLHTLELSILITLLSISLVLSLSCGIKTSEVKASSATNEHSERTLPIKTTGKWLGGVKKDKINFLINNSQMLIYQMHFEDPIKPWADRSRRELDDIQKELTNPVAVLPSNFQLDCIMMMHDSPDANSEMLSVISASQKMTADVLQRTNPNLIAAEGFYPDALTFESLADQFKLLNQFTLNTASDDEVFNDIQTRVNELMTSQDGVLVHLKYHPDVVITGTEPESLLIFRVLARDVSRGYTMSMLRDRLNTIRSYYAVAKTLRVAQQKNLQHATIVIGANHGPEIEEYGRQLGLRMNFYQTVPTEFLENQ